jgi:hypothetical protein
VHALGARLSLVIGGGNIIRGATRAARGSTGSPRTTWACWARSSMHWRCRACWSSSACRPGS